MVRRRCAPSQGEPSVRWSQVGCRRQEAQPHARSAKSRQPGLGFGDASSRPRHPRARWPHTDEEPRRIILDPSAASDRPARRPPSPSTSPGPLSSHQWRPQQMFHGGWSHSSSKKSPGSTNRIAGRAVCDRCRLGVPLPANCRLVWARSAARLSSRRRITSVGGPLPGAGRGDDEHEAKRRCCAVFLPEHDGGW